MVSTIKGERVSACHSDTFGTIFVQCGTPNNSKSKYQDFTLSLPLCGHVCVCDRIWTPKGLHMNQDNRIYPHSANIRQTFKPIRAPSFKGANKLQRSIMVHHPFPALIPFCALGSSGTFGTSGAFGGSGAKYGRWSDMRKLSHRPWPNMELS